MRVGLRVIEADEPLSLVDERRLVALGESLERQELEDGLLRCCPDLPSTGHEAIDEERGPHLGGEDHLLFVFRRQDAGSLGGVVAEDRRIEAREKTRRRDGVGGWARYLREVEELASALVAEAADVLDPLDCRSQRWDA